MSASGARSHITLALATILHGFTHAYGTVLWPLYLIMQADLRFDTIARVSFLATLYQFIYSIFSFASGMLSDRFNRKTLLGVGLVGNALVIFLMGTTHAYPMLIVLAILGGLFGTLFHPAANALAPAHYPNSPGMAIGLLGIGSGLGFCIGPWYAGLRAKTATWQVGAISAWQRPLVELGIAGMLFGILFFMFAREAPVSAGPAVPRPRRLPPLLRRRVVLAAMTLGCRDFAGLGMMSLTSIYLQKALNMDVARAGLIVGVTTIVSIVVNPLIVLVTARRRRIPGLVVVLAGAAVLLAIFPHLPATGIVPMLVVFQAFHLGSYAVGDAAMLERVAPNVRGRVVGLFLTIAGSFAALSATIVGAWADFAGLRASTPAAYALPYTVLAAMILFAAISTRFIRNFGEPDPAGINPLAEISPATMEMGV